MAHELNEVIANVNGSIWYMYGKIGEFSAAKREHTLDHLIHLCFNDMISLG